MLSTCCPVVQFNHFLKIGVQGVHIENLNEFYLGYFKQLLTFEFFLKYFLNAVITVVVQLL